MADSEERPYRRSVRMQDYDYSQPGFYFVTICIEGHRCEFGEIIKGKMHLNEIGLIAQSMWQDLPRRFPVLQLDHFVIMPNHVHGLLELTTPAGNFNKSPIPARFQNVMEQQSIENAQPRLGWIVRTFKAATTYTVHKDGKADFAWQRGYHEYVIRDEKHLENTRNYIINNPLRWSKDSLYRSP